MIQIVIDRKNLEGSVDLIGPIDDPSSSGHLAPAEHTGDVRASPSTITRATATLARRPPRNDLAPDPDLPDDTRLWAALQHAAGGIWGGCVYDADAITSQLQ